jgi:hypothetical protein
MSYEGGFGVTFNIGDDVFSGTPNYTAIAQVEEWNEMSIEAVMAEVTNHASTGGYEEHIPSGLFRTGEIELGLVFDITGGTHANASGGVTHALLNKTKLAYQVVLPDSGSTTFSFDAYVSKIAWQSPKEEKIMAKVTLRPTGQPTIA